MADHAAEGAHGPHHGASHYVKIWAILVVLFLISVAGPEVADNFDPTTGQMIVLVTAFGIAFVKAFLVIKHFMHLTIEKPIVGYILITCLVFIVLFFAGVSPDVMNHVGRNWENVAAAEEIERALAEQAAAGDGHATDQHAGQKVPEEVTDSAPTPVEEEEIAFASLDDDDAKKRWLMDRGEDVYLHGGAEKTAACVGCHRTDGTGHPPVGPPLVGMQEQMGDCKTTANIVRNGIDSDAEIDGAVYDRAMPPSASLDDEAVAAVATYVRNSWGNEFGVCTPSDI